MSEIIKQDIKDEFEDSFLRYSMAVITDRAIPDVRDGLKTVHRRYLWTMIDQMKLGSDKPYKKSATVVGQVLNVHPHGDTAVYEAAARISLNHIMRYPLIDGQGNFGTICGDGASAYRYTEMRPAVFAEMSVNGVNKNAVDMKPNFSEEVLEPTVLPGFFPNLLCNPTMGIAVGVASNFASHNLSEVVDGTIAYINNKDIDTKGLMEYIQGPDWPLGGVITNKRDLLNAYETGKSAVTIRTRADYKIEGDCIVFTSLPFGVVCDKIKEQVSKYISDFENVIANFTDQTNSRNGVRIVFELISLDLLEEALDVIFKKTDLEDTFSINQTCLVNNAPRTLSLKEIIKYYIEHQLDVIVRTSKFDYDKLESRHHILEGLVIALEDIDNVISIIKESANKASARTALISKYTLSEIQANAILDMKLSKISNLEVETVKKELAEIIKEMARLKNLFDNVSARETFLINKLLELKKDYGDARRTKLIDLEIKKKVKAKDVVSDVPVIVNISNLGIVKIAKTETKSKTSKSIKCKLSDTIVVFDNLGFAYKLLVSKITQKESAISTLVKLEPNARILNYLLLEEDKDILFVTRNGMIKSTKMSEYSSNRTVASIKLKEGDELVYANTKINFITLLTNTNTTLSFTLEDIKSTGRAGIGVKGIALKDNQFVINAFNELEDVIINNIKIDAKKINKGKRGGAAK